MDAFDPKVIAFSRYTQFAYATHLYVMPKEAFLAMAEQAPMPDKDLAMVHMTARCGSTLVTQVNGPSKLFNLLMFAT